MWQDGMTATLSPFYTITRATLPSHSFRAIPLESFCHPRESWKQVKSQNHFLLSGRAIITSYGEVRYFNGLATSQFMFAY